MRGEDDDNPDARSSASTSVAPWSAAGGELARVTPQGLKASLRRRGLTELGVFGASFVTALGLSAWHSSPVGWASLLYVVVLLAPSLAFQRFFPQRCPACGVPLESVTYEDEQQEGGVSVTAALCPRCDVEVT